MVVPEVSLDWVVRLVNDYAVPPRQAARRPAGEYADLGPGAPGLTDWPDEAGLARIADRLWQVFAGADPDERADALNGLLGPARPSPSVDGDATTHWHTTATTPAALLAAICAALAAALWFGRLFVRRLGGYTGDCLGAVQQLAEALIYIAVLATLGHGAWHA